jgi:Flp pilus assembly protein TadD
MAPRSPSPRRCRLSVAMIVRNEEDVLASTIESARSIADEILVLDTGSIDQTRDVARQLGASVHQAPWNDDFAAARNRLLSEVTGDWVLWLDAGERLLAESARELREFVDQEADPHTLYLVMVETPAADPAASNEQMAQPRLMPKVPGLRFAGRLRESVEPSWTSSGGAIGGAPGRILRHPRAGDPRRKARLAIRDLKLVALESVESRDPQPRLLVALGEACTNLDDQATARRAFIQAVEHATPGSTEMLDAYYGLLSSYDGDAAHHDRQVALCLEALEVYPLDAQLLSAMGSHLHAQGQLELAARAFETALRHGKVEPRTWHLCEITQMAAAFLALTLQTQGKDDEALAVLEEALAESPGSVRLRRHLVDLHVKHGRSEQAVRASETIPVAAELREPFRNAIRGASKAAVQDWLPALGWLQAAYVAGCREPLCLKWLAVTLLSNGEAQAAEPVLHEWLCLEPNNAEVWIYLNSIQQYVRAPEGVAFPDEPSAGDQAEQAGARGTWAGERDEWRRIRIDPGMTIAVAAPAHMPIIHQALSTDAILDASR